MTRWFCASGFVHLHGAKASEVDQLGVGLMAYLNDWWRDHLQTEFGLQSRLEVEYETHFARFLMPTVRGSDKGSKKRYAGMLEGEQNELVFKGLESVRSDWSRLARDFQRELFRRVFMDEPYEDYVRETVAGVLDGRFDDALVLRKRIRRKLHDYTKNVPPHVRAARLADNERRKENLSPRYNRGGWIEYLMTVNGAEPVRYQSSRIDYQFYIDRQLAPIADSILGFEQSSLASLVDNQLSLF